MAFQPGDKIVQFADLKSTLSQSKAIDPALYQTVQTLIERLDKFKSSHDSTVDTINNNVNKIVQNIVITPNIVATYLTLLNEVGQLPQSVQLLAGTNITFDDSVANRRIVNATSGGADLDYLGNYAPATYNDGDIVIGSDGVAYMCVKDGTTTPPEAWPGSSGGSGSGSGPHAPTHEIGGSDIIDVKLLGGYPGGTTTFLRADGTFNIPTSGVPGPHHLTHEPGGSDPLTVDAGPTIGSLRTLGIGANQAAPGNDSRFLNHFPSAHATTHYLGGPDPLTITSLAGFIGDASKYLAGNGQFLLPPAPSIPFHHTSHETNGMDAITQLSGAVITSGTIVDARLSSNVALRNVDNFFIPQTLGSGSIISGTSSLLYFQDTNSSVDQKIFRILNDSTGNFYIQKLTDNLSTVLQQWSFDIYGNFNTPSLYAHSDIYEKNRSYPVGHWIDIPYNADNFGATGGTWTVVAGAVGRFSYMLVGKTAVIQLFINNGLIGGTPESLNLVLPFTILPYQQGPVYYYYPPDVGWGLYEQPAQDPYIRIYRDIFHNLFTAGYGHIRLSLTVQIL